MLFQNAFGDQTVPNPTNYTVLAAGHLFDRESLYRNDKTAQAGHNPHGFLLDPSFVQGNVPGQTQIVTFFASDGTTIIDPDGAGASLGGADHRSVGVAVAELLMRTVAGGAHVPSATAR